MLIFVYEFICAGMDGVTAASSLRREGWAMLDAVLHDLGRCPGVQTATLLDANFKADSAPWPNNEMIRVATGEEKPRFVELARQADYTLAIAPEFDGLLVERCRWVEECGGRLLGPNSQAVRQTSDKQQLAEHFQTHGVPTPPTQPWRGSSVVAFPSVIKPRFGAGSQATFLLRNPVDIAAALSDEAEVGAREVIVQPYCDGFAASVSFLIGRGRDRILALPAAAQHLSRDGRFRYEGGAVPLSPELSARAQRIARQAVAVVDGLFGYVGVDLVLGWSSDGLDDVVIEINPRLTTSYVGLRRLARFNLAEALLAVTTGAAVPSLDWNAGPVLFDADGMVSLSHSVD